MRKFKTVIGATLIVLTLAAPAFAAFTDGSLGDLEGSLQSTGTYFWGFANNLPEGLYDVTYAYSRADRDNSWTAPNGDSLSTSMDIGSTLSSVSLKGSLFETYFTVCGNNFSFPYPVKFRPSVQIFSVLSEFSLSGISFLIGDYLVAFNDDIIGDDYDYDYDDMVLKASSRSATPIPGAVWLLGSGLVGLMGVRRKMKA